MQIRNVRTVFRSSFVALASFLATTFCLVTLIQAQQQQAPPNQKELKSKDVSDGDLKKFAAASAEVETIRADLQQKMSTVQDRTVAQKLQQQTNTQMVQVVRDNELEVSEYNALARAIDSDKELSERYQEIQKERAEKQKKQEN